MDDVQKIQWSPIEEGFAKIAFALVETQLSQGKQPVLPAKDWARMCVSLQIEAERLLQVVRLRRALPVLGGTGDLLKLADTTPQDLGTIGDKAKDAEELGIGAYYNAALGATRLIYRGARFVTIDGQPQENTLDAAKQMGWVQFALGIVGILGAVVVTMYATDRIAQVYDGSALATVALKHRLEELRLRLEKGAPLPPPGQPIDYDALVKKLADAEAARSGWLAGAGVVGLMLGGLAVYGAMNPEAFASSSSSRSSSGTRATVANPLVRGYSEDTLRHNIAILVKEGRPPFAAAGIALKQARDEYRKSHPTGPFPKHLETKAERSGH